MTYKPQPLPFGAKILQEGHDINEKQVQDGLKTMLDKLASMYYAGNLGGLLVVAIPKEETEGDIDTAAVAASIGVLGPLLLGFTAMVAATSSSEYGIKVAEMVRDQMQDVIGKYHTDEALKWATRRYDESKKRTEGEE